MRNNCHWSHYMALVTTAVYLSGWDQNSYSPLIGNFWLAISNTSFWNLFRHIWTQGTQRHVTGLFWSILKNVHLWQFWKIWLTPSGHLPARPPASARDRWFLDRCMFPGTRLLLTSVCLILATSSGLYLCKYWAVWTKILDAPVSLPTCGGLQRSVDWKL